MKLYEGWLTEEKLGRALKIMYDEEFIHNKAFPGYRFRPDYVNHDLKLVVEYNGHLHYTVAKSFLDDEFKKRVIEEEGYRLITIPYFIQIDSEVMNKLFCVVKSGIEFTDFPQGFISDKCILPADFCSLGLIRLHNELNTEFEYVAEKVRHSLGDKADRLGVAMVFPYLKLPCGCDCL